MQLLQFVAACLFPGAMSAAAAKATTKATFSEPDNASSLAFGVEAPDSGSSISSSPSSSSSSDDDHHPRFFNSRQQSPSSASPLCFGAGTGPGRLLRRSRGARARSPPKHEAASVARAAEKADVVGWYLRKISRRLRKTAAMTPAAKGSPPPPGRGADDTARERAESVARAVAYCKDTLRRGAPPPSPSLDDWLHDRQDEVMASAAAHCDGSTDLHTPLPPLRLDGSPPAAHGGIESTVVWQPPPPPPRRASVLYEMPAMEKQSKESTRLPSPSRDSDVAHGHGHDAIDKCGGESSVMEAEPPMSSSPSDLGTDELEMSGSFDEMEFLKIFDGNKEMIGRHFISIHI